ncbi:MAG: class I SAM-dependent methyltransferase [Betaproteobacteria bacterium]|nr:class I SAM-dependent methyltransferase [Betaproteobacteria bacterium]MDH3438028.1 class I SAM-dependent methyltransferase [Betaproteobacteria bacterium]
MNLTARLKRMLAVSLLLAAPGVGAQEGEGDVIYVPTPQEVVDEMLNMAKVGPSDYIIDLGSGDGRIVITAATKHGARGFGVDLDRVLLKRANENARLAGVADRAHFLEQDLFQTDLTPATVITAYLLPELNLKLRPKILGLKPGTRVVTHDYDMAEWFPDAQKIMPVPGKEVGDEDKSYIFLYTVPAKMAGRWLSQIEHGRKVVPYDFFFDQDFQFVEGMVRVGKREGKIPEFRLVGDQFEFNSQLIVEGRMLAHRFSGKVKNDTIEGTVTFGQGKAQRTRPWVARLIEAREVSYGGSHPARRFQRMTQ